MPTIAGLYVSKDDGATYNLAPDPPLLHTNKFGTFLNGLWSIAKTSQGWLASTQTPFFGLAGDGTGALIVPGNHGNTWNAISNPGNVFTGAGRTTLGVGLPGDTAVYVMFGSDGGLFTSIDGGNSFDDSRNTGLVTILGYTIGSTPTHPASTTVGTQDNGTFVRWGNNDIWEQPVGGDGFGTGWSQANDAVVLGSVEFSLLFNNFKRDPSRQAKWNVAIGGINRRFAVFNTTVATPSASTDPTGLSYFTYTSRQIYRTNDGGVSWTDIGHTTIPQKTPPNIPPSPGIGPTRIFRDTPHGIGVSPGANGLNNVAVVCNAGWVVVTHDGGATWHQTPLIGTVPNWQGFNSNVEWADDSTLYLASESPGPAGRIAKSTDGGITFTRADKGIPDVPVNRVLVSHTDPNTVYAATFLGVYRSTDGGASWARFGAGLPFVEVRDLYMPPDGSFLRISSFGRGVWEIQP